MEEKIEKMLDTTSSLLIAYGAIGNLVKGLEITKKTIINNYKN